MKDILPNQIDSDDEIYFSYNQVETESTAIESVFAILFERITEMENQ